MKRIFTHIGFAFAATLIVLNLINIKYIFTFTAGLAVLFTAGLALKKYRQALAVPLCTGAALFACILFLFSYNSFVIPEQNLNRKSAESEFYIIDLPKKLTDGKYSYTIKTKSIHFESAPQNIKLRLKTERPIYAESHQIIKAKLTFYKIGGNAFSSFGYWGNNIFLSSAIADGYVVTEASVNSPMKDILKVRQKIKDNLSRIGGDEGALSIALLTGDKSYISDSVYNNFKFAGASHLMAVSGLHLTALTGMLLFILKKLRMNGKASFLILIAATGYYCALCGFSKSVVRAGIMMTVLMLGNLFDKHSDALNSLGLATFLICLNPFAVCDIGAVLSILSVLSLCTAYPHFERKIKYLKPTKFDILNKPVIFIAKGFASAFCIGAYTLPAMFVFFGYVSVVSLISNIVLVPLGSAATIISFITSGAVRLGFGNVFILLSRAVNGLILSLAERFASFKYSVLVFENYYGIVIAGILIIFSFCFIINKRFIKTAAIISAILIALSFTSTIALEETRASIYISTGNASVIRCKGKTVVWGVNTKSDYYSVKSYLAPKRTDIDYLFISDINQYSLMLLESFDCKTVVCNTFSNKLMKNANIDELVVENSFKNSLNNDFEISCLNKNGLDYICANIYGVSFVNGNNAPADGNIFIMKGKCTDNFGTVDLSNGDIMYTISKNGAYSARRVDIWQE